MMLYYFKEILDLLFDETCHFPTKSEKKQYEKGYVYSPAPGERIAYSY